jgi:N-acetyl-gamma-glutamyl-phosphate reductase
MGISVGIVGVTGYTGQELLRILLAHPDFSVRYLASLRLSHARPVSELIPAFTRPVNLRVEPFQLSKAAEDCEVLLLALPSGSAMALAPQLFRKNKSLKIVDLSGDFRLKSTRLFQRAYHLSHKSPGLIREAVYGLTEWAREELRSARLVANPGCYPTAALLALLPLAKQGLLASRGLTVDAKSGVTGAGRALKEELLHAETAENFRAYKVNDHQHMPEIEQTLFEHGGKRLNLTFVPHLVPMNRGLLATIYAPLAKKLTLKGLRTLFDRAYAKEPFVRLLPPGVWPQTKSVGGTNRCDLAVSLDPASGRAILLAAIDNLGKGAAGQAVQNMNLLFDLPETSGLI